jgi:hypothetical protein
MSARFVVTTVIVAAFVGSARLALAESERLPSMSIGGGIGLVSGAGANTKPLGIGIGYGIFAQWQPMRADQRWGVGLRWATTFIRHNVATSVLPAASSAQITPDIRLVQADIAIRVRFAPTNRTGSYLTFGPGLSMLRSNQPVSPETGRVWAGGFFTIGFDRYVANGVLISIDARYGLIGNGPTSLAGVISVGYGV